MSAADRLTEAQNELAEHDRVEDVEVVTGDEDRPAYVLASVSEGRPSTLPLDPAINEFDLSISCAHVKDGKLVVALVAPEEN